MALFNLVIDNTFTSNDELHVVIPCNIAVPDTLNDELHVVAPFNIAVPVHFMMI